MFRLPLAVVLATLAAAACGGDARETVREDAAPPAPRLRLPYDVAIDAAGVVHVADGLLHQVLRRDSATGRAVVVAGTGVAGSGGDGGPATAADLDEPVGIAFDADGSLLVADFNAGSVRRIGPDGTISTLAGGLDAPAAVAVHPSGRSIAVPALSSVVVRIDLASGALETIAGDGTPMDAGDGGPAERATVESPHGADYDDAGNLYLPASDGSVRRIDAETGMIETLAATAGGAAAETFKVLAAPDGSLYLVAGTPAGGVIRRLAPDGTLTVVVGTGTIGPAGDGLAATEIGILPSDVAVAPDGALIFSQTEPVPAVRRVDPETGLVETVLR